MGIRSIESKKRKRIEEDLKKTRPLSNYFVPTNDASATGCPLITLDEQEIEQSVEHDGKREQKSFTPVETETTELETEAAAPLALDTNHTIDTTNLFLSDDPAQWPSVVNNDQRTSLVKKGPVQVIIFDFPADDCGRRFSNQQ